MSEKEQHLSLPDSRPNLLRAPCHRRQVGSSAVSSGPLVDAISRWDVRKSEAAEQAGWIVGSGEDLGLDGVSGIVLRCFDQGMIWDDT